jgi:carboxyl-terminal processing protease
VVAAGITLCFTWKPNHYTKLEALRDLLMERYINGADATKLEDAAAHAMVGALGDRWSYNIPADEFAAYVEQKNNAYVGIGVTITAVEEGYSILNLTEGGPAEEAGILVGDIIVAVDGTRIAGMPTEEGSALVKGKEGTKVNITVLRNQQELTISVERRTVKTKVATAKMLEGQIGLVTIKNFNANCFTESKEAAQSLLDQGAVALIFDVRYNGGGYVNEMVKLLDYLLPEGEIFRSLDYMGKENVEKSNASCVEVPMAVLVNGSSYSAAEFFAAALREYDWATTVGTQTCGKCYYPNTFTLSDGSAVNISTGKYFTPKGVSLAEIGGLTPDIPVEVDENTDALIYAQVIEPANDPQLQAAVAQLQKTPQ